MEARKGGGPFHLLHRAGPGSAEKDRIPSSLAEGKKVRPGGTQTDPVDRSGQVESAEGARAIVGGDLEGRGGRDASVSVVQEVSMRIAGEKTVFRGQLGQRGHEFPGQVGVSWGWRETSRDQNAGEVGGSMADASVRVFPGHRNQDTREMRGEGVGNARGAEIREASEGLVMTVLLRQQLERGGDAAEGLVRVGPGVEKDFEGFVGQLHAVGEQVGGAGGVALLESAGDEPSEGLLSGLWIPKTFVEFGGFFPFFQFLEALGCFHEETAFGEAKGGFAGIVKGMLEDDRCFAEVVAAFQGVGCGDPISEKVSVDIRSATVATQAHFAVGHFPIAEAKDLPEGGRD